MSFYSFRRMVSFFEFVIYICFTGLFMVITFEQIDPVLIHLLIYIVFVFIIGLLLFPIKRLIFNSSIKKRFQNFNDELNIVKIQGVAEYLLERAQSKRRSSIIKNNNLIFSAYLFHDMESKSQFEGLDVIEEIEQRNYDEFNKISMIAREVMMFRFFEQGKFDQGLETAKRQLTYIESMVDDEKIPEELLENELNISSTYRHIIRFLERPNLNNAFAICPKNNKDNLSRVKIHFMIAHYFIKNGRLEEAKTAAQRIGNIEGNYRLLERLKEYAN